MGFVLEYCSAVWCSAADPHLKLLNRLVSGTRFLTGGVFECDHRVDSVIESSLRKIIGSKNFALINLSLNFCETTIYDNKVFLENFVAVDSI